MKFNQKLIDKVLNKEASILHTQNPDDLEILIQLLKTIFPEDKYKPSGSCKYYYHHDSNSWGSNNYDFKGESIPLKDFILKELLAAWCVKNDGSQLFKDTVIKYLNDKYNKGLQGDCENYYYGVDITGNFNFLNLLKNIDKYFENNILTLEEFIEITQMNTKNTDKKIIGYKCPTDMFNGGIPKNTLYVRKYSEVLENGYYSKDHLESNVYYLPKEIVETWEPVYEEENYKVGDYVVLSNSQQCSNGHGREDNKVYIIVEENAGANKDQHRVSNDLLQRNGNGIIYKKYIRRATKEEITAKKAELFEKPISINNYKLKITSKNSFKFGCNNFTRKELEAYILLVEREAQITMFGTKIDLELLNKIKIRLDIYE